MNSIKLRTGVIVIIAIISFVRSWEPFDQMYWTPGDRIGCLLHGVAGFFGWKHWMLGADYGVHIIHMTGDDGTKNGLVLKEHYNMVKGGMTDLRYCVNWGKGYHGIFAVGRAEKMVGKKLYYNTATCNCWDYVNYWADGEGYDERPVC